MQKINERKEWRGGKKTGKLLSALERTSGTHGLKVCSESRRQRDEGKQSGRERIRVRMLKRGRTRVRLNREGERERGGGGKRETAEAAPGTED